MSSMPGIGNDLGPAAAGASSNNNNAQRDTGSNALTTAKITLWDKMEPAFSHHRGTTVAISIAYGLFGLSHLWRGNLLTAAAFLAPLGAVIKVAYPQQGIYVKSFLDDVWAPTAAAIQKLGQNGLALLKGNNKAA